MDIREELCEYYGDDLLFADGNDDVDPQRPAEARVLRSLPPWAKLTVDLVLVELALSSERLHGGFDRRLRLPRLEELFLHLRLILLGQLRILRELALAQHQQPFREHGLPIFVGRELRIDNIGVAIVFHHRFAR